MCRGVNWPVLQTVSCEKSSSLNDHIRFYFIRNSFLLFFFSFAAFYFFKFRLVIVCFSLFFSI